MNLIARLRALAEQQKDRRGDYLYRGSADPEIVEAATALEIALEALEDIARYDVGLQAMIEDGKDSAEERATYYASQVERRRTIARAAIERIKGV